jgi:hypothetical protein
MNNSWKVIGGGGAALGSVLQLWNVYRALEWGEGIIPAILFFISYAAIATGFFMAQNETAVVAARSESASPEGGNGDIPSVGQWLGWMLLLSIPLVNLVLMIMWATDKGNQIRRNWILATLVITGIVTVLYAILMATMLSSMSSMY